MLAARDVMFIRDLINGQLALQFGRWPMVKQIANWCAGLLEAAM